MELKAHWQAPADSGVLIGSFYHLGVPMDVYYSAHPEEEGESELLIRDGDRDSSYRCFQLWVVKDMQALLWNTAFAIYRMYKGE